MLALAGLFVFFATIEKTMDLFETINNVTIEFEQDINNCQTQDEVKDLQIKYLGRKSGLVTGFFKQLGSVPPEEKSRVGKEINNLKVKITGELEQKLVDLEQKDDDNDVFDPTVPGRYQYTGRLHPLTVVMDEMISVFHGLGFEIATGPEVETDYYNFEALNFPDDHPARNLQDTFYLDDGRILRTHTSPVQVRVMEKQKPPIRIIAPGRVFRKDTPDATHTPVFHQVEGLYVDKGVTLAELKGTLLAFARAMFGPGIDVRFRA